MAGRRSGSCRGEEGQVLSRDIGDGLRLTGLKIMACRAGASRACLKATRGSSASLGRARRSRWPATGRDQRRGASCANAAIRCGSRSRGRQRTGAVRARAGKKRPPLRSHFLESPIAPDLAPSSGFGEKVVWVPARAERPECPQCEDMVDPYASLRAVSRLDGRKSPVQEQKGFRSRTVGRH